MGDFDVGGVTFSDGTAMAGPRAHEDNETLMTGTDFEQFLMRYDPERRGTFPYREQLRRCAKTGRNYAELDIDDLMLYNPALGKKFLGSPAETLEIFERVAKSALRQVVPDLERFGRAEDPSKDVPFQLLVRYNKDMDGHASIRSIDSSHMSRVVTVEGIVVSASRTQAKPIRLMVKCRTCGHEKILTAAPGLWIPQIPPQCEANVGRDQSGECPPNSYAFVAGECTCIDHQILKLQESPHTVPTGELPRTLLLSVDGALVGRAQPGSRITVTGLYLSMSPGKGSRERTTTQTIKVPYVRVLDIRTEAQGGRTDTVFSSEDEERFKSLAKRRDIYDLLARSIAPAIYGHEDIKKAVLAQMFGGTVKFLDDGVKLRGDINVLLLGDPGTAKSQLLKFVEKAAPIGVYTSGKGSSAAGLTAAVIRDGHTREFYLEGGAMVLADGGIVCIDEFDKMDANDRVAIHEAMEQQTISIAKAGITTILNSRAAVLAAANPVFGSYDASRGAAENIDLQTTILSRFDMIFLIRDTHDYERDRDISSHVITNHFEDVKTTAAAATTESDHLSVPFLKKYIAYCRSKCAPHISLAASQRLEDFFVQVRDSTRLGKTDAIGPLARGSQSKIPITVRQLEAIVRVSEALAKLSLSDEAKEEHVDEAIRLFNASTVNALNTGKLFVPEMMSPEMVQEVRRAEDLIRRTLPIDTYMAEKKLLATLRTQGVSQFAGHRAVITLVQQGELEYRRKRQVLYRKH